MAQIQNFEWDQGSDLVMALIYKEGATADTAVAIDLSTGYSVRMDMVMPGTKQRIYTFNTDVLADVDPITVGSQPDTVVEGVLTSGVGGTANISIVVPRSLTLPPSGAVYAKYVLNQTVFSYDIFLRNTVTDKQAKILQGSVTILDSSTLWV